MTTGASGDASAEIENLIRQVPNLSAPSTAKFAPIINWFAQRWGLAAEDVRVYYISKPGNLNVRFSQPGVAQHRRVLGVALIKSLSDVEPCLGPARALVGPGRNLRVMVLCAPSNSHGWTLRAVAASAGDPLTPHILADFPGIPVHPPSGNVMHSPAGTAAAVPLILDERIKRMVRLAVAAAPAVMLVGPPGTGKSTMLDEVIREIDSNRSAYGFTRRWGARWVTPEESWTARELTGGETVDESGHLKFRPGHVLEAIERDEWLVLDEANRADMDKIFGGLLTWLAGHEVVLGRASTSIDAADVILSWSGGPGSRLEGFDLLTGSTQTSAGANPKVIRYLAGAEWRLLGTYNALDAQRVFRWGQALGRRFVRVPIPPMSAQEFRGALGSQVADLPPSAHARIAGLYEAHLAGAGTQLGPALFFWLPEYIRAGVRIQSSTTQPVSDTASDDNAPGQEASTNGQAGSKSSSIDDVVAALVAEAYLSTAGVWLAKLGADELAGLEQRIIAGGALKPEDWAWIVGLLPALG